MNVYAQFGGAPCSGGRTETQSCQTTKGCPLEDGCGGRFRCRSGQCISQSLVCNGDQDCEEDGLDEQCPPFKHIVCNKWIVPPNIEHLGLGVDVVTGKTRASVINTKSFGGQCRTFFSGVHNNFYRLPLSVLQYTVTVKVQNSFSDDMFQSKWHYAKEIVNRETATGTTTGFRNYNFKETDERTRYQRLLVLKNNIELGQFQSNSPRYLPISEEFWKALAKLPAVYDYAAYRKVLERFGTHYRAAGSLGGSFSVVAKIDEETQRYMLVESSRFEECDRTKRWILFFPLTIVKCKKDHSYRERPKGFSNRNEVKRVDLVGGSAQHTEALKVMDLDNPDQNWVMYSNWADSIRSFPEVIKQTLRPLSELVKEVQCAGMKKVYLRRAIEQYLSESDSCHCRPCANNGLAVMDGDECKCICKPGTSGLGCEQGAEAEGQPGVIHGSWSCWSSWSSCSASRSSRSRSCSNPAPQNGGQGCTGESMETSDCEDEELLYLRTMEPQCFDQTLPARAKCATPPALVNGYVLEPQDIYLEGSRVEYSCTAGFHLVGPSMLECQAGQTWSSGPGLCMVQRCTLGSLSEDVIANPVQENYHIGQAVTLSCPEGKQLDGVEEVSCNPSQEFSPDPANVRCVTVAKQEVHPVVQCKPWEKSARGNCVCKMPFECRSSLNLCATSVTTARSVLLSVCQLHALQCIGKSYNITEDGACEWPARANTTGCTGCHMWESCDAETNQCRCEASTSCLNAGIQVCVRVGEDETAESQTMSECEAGLRRCRGERVSLVGILPCTA